MARNKRQMPDLADEGPNLIPIMNLMVILIPFLLLSAVFVKVSILNTSLPSGASAAEAQAEPEKPKEEEEKPKLNLTVTISQIGFNVAGSGAVLPGPKEGGPTVPKTGDDWPYEELNKKLIEIKKNFPEEKDCIIIPEQGSAEDPDRAILYQVIISTMDAVREAKNPVVDSDGDGVADRALFPGVIIGAGIL